MKNIFPFLLSVFLIVTQGCVKDPLENGIYDLQEITLLEGDCAGIDKKKYVVEGCGNGLVDEETCITGIVTVTQDSIITPDLFISEFLEGSELITVSANEAILPPNSAFFFESELKISQVAGFDINIESMDDAPCQFRMKLNRS